MPILAVHAGNGSWTVVGWNNLGMHCMDDDYSVFSILPPYNTIDAQLIDAAGQAGQDRGSGITLTYEAVADPDGSINRTAAGKTNFWDYAPAVVRRSAAAWKRARRNRDARPREHSAADQLYASMTITTAPSQPRPH